MSCVSFVNDFYLIIPISYLKTLMFSRLGQAIRKKSDLG